MKLIFTILIAFSMGLNPAFAQKNVLKGKVLNEASQPIAGVTMILEGTVRGVQSDPSGHYVMRDIPEGKYVLKVNMLGYKEVNLPFSIGERENLALNINLQEALLSLDPFEFSVSRGIMGQERLPEVDKFRINAGKKNEVIRVGELNANLAMNNSRQIFSRTPGISIWENDGSGIQLGVATRGLNPNRSWEFNVRMNGYDITPDPMGYPEAYYTPPMEVVEQIEIVRGASSIQYGSQFGGLMNFVMRKPDKSTRFTFETLNTVGSNGLFSSFNYLGGTEGKWSYTAYYQKRVGNGWRENSYFNTDHAHVEVNYAANNRLMIGLEMTYMGTESQQPGGLTDEQFNKDSRSSTRERNWFSTPWFIPALTAEYILSDKTKLSWKTFGTFAERNSVGFMQPINQEDDLGNRQVDRDFYTTYGSELRMITEYSLFGKSNTLAAGIRYFNGFIDRKQVGGGDNGTQMNFDLADGGIYRRDFDFTNINQAAFAENVFRFSDKWLLTTGLRYERISSNMEGLFNTVNDQEQILLPQSRTRNFFLVGIGSEYKINPSMEFYSNFSQAYRPVLISDLTPPATTDSIDDNLQDSRGFNFDFGYRGAVQNWMKFDVGYFYLNYADRIGTIATMDNNGIINQFRTNLGNSVSQGFEGYVEFDPISALSKTSKFGYLHLFASLAFVDARYGDFATTSVREGVILEGNLKGNRVENAPRKINRYGATYRYDRFSVTWQLSDIGDAFSDASNTVLPNAAATVGLIPAYQVQDLSASTDIRRRYIFRAGINNLTNSVYFTRRAGGYPGPGIMPGDGRTFYFTFGLKL
ncbi:TonB-denpendent receptor [Rhodonellum psychrophilum GCM71 = DSM 17998]|uniref:TonB-denpendent receptor n=2 Tax=Rhodonellum TaxID=336827 RepID=U5BJC5_9BACT|nr:MULTISPECIES: TonB-dependent receptor [Rhodonellum]ERM80530.1 TonB-denpendent receptor [Rhodonellum psychrophilum GCM71 = DSM 17998]SDZ31609.1 Fe(3+) dicitrate transport protein [Rhodonellum ikkaensis]